MRSTLLRHPWQHAIAERCPLARRFVALAVWTVALCASNCAHARPPGSASPLHAPLGELAGALAVRSLAHAASAARQATQRAPGAHPTAATSRPARPPTVEELQQALQRVLADPALDHARVSVLAIPAGHRDAPLFAAEADALRVPASNAKLLTSTAAQLALPGRYRFVTEVGQHRGRIYVRGTGDPLLRRADLVRLARAVRARGVTAARGVVFDDSYYGREQLAPGFAAFGEGSFYRPTSSALNVDQNALEIIVTAPKNRRRPRIDVLPPSDYVRVRHRVRLARTARRNRRGEGTRIDVRMQRRGAVMLLTLTGTFDPRSRAWRARRAVYDPAFNAAWAFHRALVTAGVRISGGVIRGRWSDDVEAIAARSRPLSEVLRATNTHSDNLAAETLVRALGSLEPDDGAASQPSTRRAPQRRGSWPRGLQRLERELGAFGLSGFTQGNGSGLHRGSKVSARLLVALLDEIQARPELRAALVPTLAVAGRSGTLARRFRGTAAEGLIAAKTGTLGNALALSGYVDPAGPRPLVFSMLVNGRADRLARSRIDRVAGLLCRYARGLPLVEEGSAEAEPEEPEEPGPSDADASVDAAAPPPPAAAPPPPAERAPSPSDVPRPEEHPRVPAPATPPLERHPPPA
jgi:D-alanyl-D-alanine carboxypeptidase/D-alanyl-D-alanine-endopeptidase (penicillin-binding protein 4)